jgi:hypothetical protein
MCCILIAIYFWWSVTVEVGWLLFIALRALYRWARDKKHKIKH